MAICDATRGLDAGRGVFRHRGVSDGSDGARPLLQSHSARTEKFFADVFPRGGRDHEKYTISLLDAWSNHGNPTLRQTAIRDPSEWAGDMSAESGPCLQDFDLVSQAIAKVYSVKD